MTAPATRSDGGSSFALSSSGPAFVVSRDEVLAKRAALLAEAADFQQFLLDNREDLLMKPMGGDPVSIDVAGAVTDRIRDAGDSYYNVCRQWVDNLRQTAEALAEVARQYGYTDEEIAASFRGAVPDA